MRFISIQFLLSLNSYRAGRSLHGVVYFHRISDIRMAGALRKSFSMFTKLCGDDALKNVVIVTNMWSKVTKEEGNARQRELETDNRYFKPALDKGAAITRHDNTSESALSILRKLLNNHPMPLGIQRELVDSGKHFLETEVAQEVNHGLQTLIQRQIEEVKSIKAEIEKAMGTKDLKAARALKEEQRKASALLIKIQELSRNLAPDYHKQQHKASRKFSGKLEDSDESGACGCIVA
jgi:hypothetical protein